MDDDDHYDGREQTGIKHKVLREYLNIACRIVGPVWGEFVYIDGFSGPWQAEADDFSDTSFMIAIDTLSRANSASAAQGKPFNVRYLFLEKKLRSFKKLSELVGGMEGISTATRHGSFEDEIPYVIDYVDRSFYFAFIDPTGWTGLSLRKLSPLLQMRGEVLINFMSRFINRFITSESSEDEMNDLMGDGEWRTRFDAFIHDGLSREAATMECYRQQLKKIGEFKYVKNFRVLDPGANRTYFHLVYGTDHIRGLEKFSEVEKRIYPLQAKIHLAKKLAAREQKTRTRDLFSEPDSNEIENQVAQDRQISVSNAQSAAIKKLKQNRVSTYEEIESIFLERALVWKSDFQEYIIDLSEQGVIEIEGLVGRQRVPHSNCTFKIA